jgi:hypothetical protein
MINFITISILDFGVTSHNVIDQSMIINFEMKKTLTKRVLYEIYLMYVSNTYHMNFECVWVHLYLLEAAMWVYRHLYLTGKTLIHYG